MKFIEFMAKSRSKGARIRVGMEWRSERGQFLYYTSKNRRNTVEKLELRKYCPVTQKHEIFKEKK
jgi:large subunit ribosomal protein L33